MRRIRINPNIIINVDAALIQAFDSYGFDDEYLKKLVAQVYRRKKPIIISHYKNVSPMDRHIELDVDSHVYTKRQIRNEINKKPKKNILECAALGLFFACFIQFQPTVTDIRVCVTNEGFDYKCKRGKSKIKIEITGVNSENDKEFNSRIGKKTRKFRSNDFFPEANEEYLSVIDFFFCRYIIWDIR
jgi:hypothetical protein